MKFEPRLEAELSESRCRIDTAIREILQELDLPKPLGDSAAYVLLDAGKRLRPIIALLIAQDLGASDREILPAAIAVEFLHAASLIHDDLPGMDDDDFRRGKPSCHKQFGVATALLLGDLLPAVAFEYAALCDNMQLNQCVARSYRLLCVGQQLDMLNASGLPELMATHRRKTGALFGAAFVTGVSALSQGATACEVAWRVGEEFGLLFQMVDDYRDQFGDAKARGRPESSDARNQKNTLFRLLSRSQGCAAVAQQYETFTQELSRLEAQLESPLRRVRSMSATILAEVSDDAKGPD